MPFLIQKKVLPSWHDKYANSTDTIDIDELVITSNNSNYPHGPELFDTGSSFNFSRYLAYNNGFSRYISKFKQKVSGNTTPIPLIYKGCGVFTETDGFYGTKRIEGSNEYRRDILYLHRNSSGIQMKHTHFTNDDWYDSYGFNYPRVPSDGYGIFDHSTGSDAVMTGSSYVTTSTLVDTSKPPYQLYFELCSAGGGSGGSTGYASSPGGGGGATLCGILDFTECNAFQIGIGSTGSWGVSGATEATNGYEGGYSYIIGRDKGTYSTYYSDDNGSYDASAFDFVGIILVGGGGGQAAIKGTSNDTTTAVGGSGGYAFILKGTSYKYKDSNGNYAFSTVYDDDEECGAMLIENTHGKLNDGRISSGIYVLNYHSGGAGGKVNCNGTSVSALTSTFCTNATYNTPGGAGGSSDWGGGGGGSAMGAGGGGARYNNSTYAPPGDGGGGGGKGLYWMGQGQNGAAGGYGAIRFGWSTQSTLSNTMEPLEVSLVIEQYMDPTTGQLGNRWTAYCIVDNPNDQAVTATVTYDKGTVTDYDTYTRTINLSAAGSGANSYAAVDMGTSNSSTWSDGFRVVVDGEAADGQTCTVGPLILNSSVWSPPSSTGSS